MNQTAIAMALGSAVLFGVSAPAAKWLLGALDPWLLAGLLYLGAGVGLALVRVLKAADRETAEARLARRDLPWLAASILCGGVAAPVLLMFGLLHVDAAAASLLLTLEGVLTALLAWFVFRENFDRRIAVGMLCIVAGAVVLNWQQGVAVRDLAGPLAIAGACLAWAIDNNLTRKIALADPMQIAMVKGLVAGPVSLAVAFGTGSALPGFGVAGLGLLAGFLGYGVSLALFVRALRDLGTARTSAYFGLAPFVGALVAVPLFGEPVQVQLFAAGALMAVGVWLHLSERHEHAHSHAQIVHEHRHAHDEHHAHDHDTPVAAGVAHSHWHAHEPLRHAHPHLPDSHHRHTH
jgi:drug/metabolite transporter (DMT)-like permease